MWKKIRRIAVVVLLISIFALWAIKAHRDAHYFDNYDPAAPLNVVQLERKEINGETPENSYILAKFTFDGFGGEKVPALMSMPMLRTGKKLPAIVMLHGIGQNKNAMIGFNEPFNRCGFAFLCFDQYTKGDRKLPANRPHLEFITAFDKRPGKTVNETRRLVDYLSAHPDIDPQRIYLLGVSYGAITGSTVLAKEKRLRAGVLVYGGGDFGKLLDSPANHLFFALGLGLIDGKNLNATRPPLTQLSWKQDCIVSAAIACVTPVARYIGGVSDPIHYVDTISPTPVYFQNGKYDALIPPASGKALQEAAGEPKTISWYDTAHVGVEAKPTNRVFDDSLKWLVEQDDPFRAPGEKVTELPRFGTGG